MDASQQEGAKSSIDNGAVSGANSGADSGHPRRQRFERRGVALALLAFVVLGLWYSMAVPPFETPDEPFHYAFSRHIAQGNRLPVQSLNSTGPWHQEGSQAPLYYLLTGWLTAGIDQGDFEALSTRNQSANIGDPLFPGNKNYMRYSGVRQPLAGSNLALHVGRWFSLVLGVVTLVAIYLTARLMLHGENERTWYLPLLSLWVAALIPQFAFISASFSNDSMVIAASAVTVWWLIRLLVRPLEEPIRWWELLLLGLFLGIAALSKLQGLGLGVVVALAGLWMTWQRRDWRLLARAVLLVVLPALVIAGWWYWRNYTLYGDWFGLSNLLAINGQRENPLSWRGFVGEFRGLRYSFWGLFGWFNILMPSWIYQLLDLLTIVAVAGIVGVAAMSARALRRQRLFDLPALTVLILWATLSFALWFYWTSQATGSQGRLLYPGLVAFTPLFVSGLWWWLRPLPPRVQPILWALLLALLLGSSLYVLIDLVPGSYNQPATIAELPDGLPAADVIYGEQERLTLLSVEMPQAQRFGFGQEVPVTLYLRADQTLSDDYRLFIQLLDEQGQEIANVTSHPGWGRNPTTLWAPGAIYADDYLVRIERIIDDRSPLLADVYIGFINPATEQEGKLPLVARSRDGQEIAPFLGQIEVEPIHPPTSDEYDLTTGGPAFGNLLKLEGYGVASPHSLAAGEALTVTLLWEAGGEPTTDYTVYAHLLDEAGNRAAGYDREPAADRFPTSRWRAGDRILSRLPIELDEVPPGDYALWVGVYESESQGAVRLPLSDGGGFVAGDGQVLLEQITVVP